MRRRRLDGDLAVRLSTQVPPIRPKAKWVSAPAPAAADGALLRRAERRLQTSGPTKTTRLTARSSDSANDAARPGRWSDSPHELACDDVMASQRGIASASRRLLPWNSTGLTGLRREQEAGYTRLGAMDGARASPQAILGGGARLGDPAKRGRAACRAGRLRRRVVPGAPPLPEAPHNGEREPEPGAPTETSAPAAPASLARGRSSSGVSSGVSGASIGGSGASGFAAATSGRERRDFRRLPRPPRAAAGPRAPELGREDLLLACGGGPRGGHSPCRPGSAGPR